jgi:hypothetical protein
MFGNATEFLWKRPAGGVGYEIHAYEVPDGTPEQLVVAKPDARLEQYAPLREEPALFLMFSETELTEEGVLQFVNAWGLLGGEAAKPLGIEWGTDPPGVEFGDKASVVLKHARLMREAVRLWDQIRRGDQEGLADSFEWQGPDSVVYLRPENVLLGLNIRGSSEPTVLALSPDRSGVAITRDTDPSAMASFTPGDLVGPARVWLHFFVNAGLDREARLKLRWQPGEGQDVLDVLPDSLLSILWLQLALAIAGNKEYRRCYQCGRPFELAPDVNRTSRLTCSAACRNRAYRERQDRARQLHAEGKSFKQIARELESTVKTVKGWVTGRKEK